MFLSFCLQPSDRQQLHPITRFINVDQFAVAACIHVLTSTACSINYTAHQCIHLHLQGKFLHLSCILSGIFRMACSQCKLILLISDGGSQLRAHPPNAQGQGIYPARYLAEPGWDQPRGHPFLSHASYSQHATPLPWQPVHPPL